MKFAKLSLAAVAALGLASSAMAGNIDVKFGGQAVLYYQTLNKDSANLDFFDKDGSRGNVGLQIRSTADLKNGFTAGITANIIGTAGLEGNLVSNVMQAATEDANGDLGSYWIPEAYVAKTMGKTTVKIGRQYLNTPLAFSEGWNVFKNSFEAGVLINQDLPDTTLVLAMVNKANGNGLGAVMDKFNYINSPVATDANGKFAGFDDGAVYALGIINNSVPNLNVALWGYNLTSLATAGWVDLSYKVNAGVPLTLAGHAATLSPEDNIAPDDTTMYGVKIGANISGFNLSVAYDDVDDGSLPIHNVGTGVKTKLFSQQILNQKAIKKDASTWQLKVVTPAFAGVKAIAQYAATDAGDKNLNGANNDLDEFDLILKTKVSSTNLLVAYVNQSYENGNMDQDLIRVVARYKF